MDEIIKNNLQINISETEPKNLTCLPSKRKLFWKNQTRIDLKGARKEIQEKDSVEISYENSEDFCKRENPKVSIIITIYNQNNLLKIYMLIFKNKN